MAFSYDARGEGKYGHEPHKMYVHEHNIVSVLYVEEHTVAYVGLGILFAGSEFNLWG